MNDTSNTPADKNSVAPLGAPTRVVVTLKAGLIFALANIVCVVIAVIAYTHVHRTIHTISVTGWASKNIKSNLIIWTGTVTDQSPDLADGYKHLAADTAAVVAFLEKHAIPPAAIRTSSIAINTNYARDRFGHLTDTISSYNLSQNILVTSRKNLRQVASAGRLTTRLIEKGIAVTTAPPQYLYTHLSRLKISMLADATRDARVRAGEIATNSGARLGKIIYARMGVLQIDPIYSDSVSSEGNDDTTSYRKTVMAVVHSQFQLK